MTRQPAENPSAQSRRDFIKRGSSLLVAGGMVAGSLKVAQGAHAFGDETIKIGLIGCGGRGTGAAAQAMNTGDVKIVAMADAFGDRLQASARGLKSQHPQKFDVPADRQFVGFDGYKHVLESDCDLVILATPPGFRPLHVEAAVNAGKHVFMEKPVAVDAPGVNRVLKATAMAKKKNLALAVGLQRRHENKYRETISAIQDGAIGDIVLARAYWNGAGVWTRPREEGQTELEYQMRNWYYFNWVCGDHIVEQHIHNLDVINWVMGGYPVSGQGQGGREVRTSNEHGQIFDHHMIEFTYENGGTMLSQCRHIRSCWNSVSEHVHGTRGRADISGGKIYNAAGDMIYNWKGGREVGHQLEHDDLFANLRKGEIQNEGEYGAKSTMTAIFGRMCTYSGQKISWDEAIGSDLTLANVDAMTSMQDEPPVKPFDDMTYPVAVPGVTKAL